MTRKIALLMLLVLGATFLAGCTDEIVTEEYSGYLIDYDHTKRNEWDNEYDDVTLYFEGRTLRLRFACQDDELEHNLEIINPPCNVTIQYYSAYGELHLTSINEIMEAT